MSHSSRHSLARIVRAIGAMAAPVLASAVLVLASAVLASTVSANPASASMAPDASSAPAAAPRWHTVKSVATNYAGVFTAVAPTGKTTGWAFDGLGYTAPPAAYQLSGTTWKRAAFPGRMNEEVITAAATSPTDVWAFTQGLSSPSRVLHYNGHTWSVVRKFNRAIADATVLASNDVWVYGDAAVPGFQAALGVWHYNGSSWTQVSKTFQGGSALSGTNVWGFSGVRIEHWTGRKWIATSVKPLLPPTIAGGLNDPQVVGVLALSPSNVYAIGSGIAQDEGGPDVVLHYNGFRWTKLATGHFGYGPGPEISSDGSGGLWLPMNGPVGGTAHLVHYAAGRLAPANLPVAAPAITVVSVARIPGTTQQVAGGYTHASGDRGTNVVAVLLKYS
jgi:hypothetical protein